MINRPITRCELKVNTMSSFQSLENLQFDNSFSRLLPGDLEAENFRRQVKAACYSPVKPSSVSAPELVAYSREMAAQLGLDYKTCESKEFVRVFSGNQLLGAMQPFAMCYGGHQFGNWAGQLGDGRAINLGEVINDRGQHWALQLKGAGPTPYSRTADGLAVLRSSVREFLCSEAMFHLGVPTTRALSLITTGDQVVRDMLYDGNAKPEPGAIVCRAAPSFIRFGNFEIFASRGEKEILKQLLDYTIGRDFPHLGASGVETYIQWFREVCQRTAEMVVHWMRVGFVHGVMNTDNMSILGLTIDYGPYGWLEDYDPNWTPNTTDSSQRRYRFGQQGQIAQWNLLQLAQAVYPLIEDAQPLEEALAFFADEYQRLWHEMMVSKLGLPGYQSTTDDVLVNELLEIMSLLETDMTWFYRGLAKVDLGTGSSAGSSVSPSATEISTEPLQAAYYQLDQIDDAYRAKLQQWLQSYSRRFQQSGISDEQRSANMNQVNPVYVLRNYLAQLAIDKSEQGDHTMVNELLEVLRNPYQEQAGMESYAQKRPEWARHRAGCSMLSCSS